jgi:hypothetical protein
MNVLNISPEELRQMAARDFETALGGMSIENLIPWEKIGVEPMKPLTGEGFAQLAHDDRRAVIDSIHDIAMLPVYEKNTGQERDAAHKSIDFGVRTAKWRFVLSLTNEAYGFGYDYVDLEMMSPLCAQLATIERGATNVHMPTTHKLRHNPACHSVHVAGLVKDVFDEMAENNADLSAADMSELRDMQKQLMRAALVHDMGELQGELSIASNRKHMSAAEMEAFEHNRGLTETEVFENALTRRVSTLEKVRWPAEMLNEKRDSLLNDYTTAEESSVYMGRAHKLMERMQSQQDYLRFEGLSGTPKLNVIIKEEGDHKDFMRSYAQEPMHGTANGEKVRPTLAELAEDYQNPALAKKLVEVLEGRLDSLQKTIDERIEYKPKTFAERFLEGVRTNSQSAGMSR